MTTLAASHAMPPPDTLSSSDVGTTARTRRPFCESRVLFAGGKELVIFHHGEPYRLRETRQGKLILTK